MLCRLFLCALLALSVSCVTPPGGGTQPAEAWVHASRATHDVLAPRFADYVEGDLSLSPLLREVLLGTLSDWDWMIQQGENIYPPAAAIVPAVIQGEPR